MKAREFDAGSSYPIPEKVGMIIVHIFEQRTSGFPGINMFAATWTFARSWCPAFLILIPHEDKVDVITPFNILVIGGGDF